MPIPIRPISKEYDLDIFNGSFEEDKIDYLSELQKNILASPANITASASKKKEHFASLLEVIAKSEDLIVTAAMHMAYSDKEKTYRVPSEINDMDLLGLKTHGLVQGQGRLVKLTESGVKILRDKWLKSDNSIKAQKTKPKFDILKEPKFAYSATNQNYVDHVAMKAIAGFDNDQKIAIAERLLEDIKDNHDADFIYESQAYLRHLIGIEKECPNINVATRTLVANRLASSVTIPRR
jgi:hypothetical protein